jgi:hypothetical protein
MSDPRQPWDLGRFVQTLAYFEAIPVVSWLQKMFQPPLPPPTPPVTIAADTHWTLFDFGQTYEIAQGELSQTWGAVDDVVMGGVSDSRLMPGGEGAIFSGNVSTDNSGGFASVRTRNFEPGLNLSDYRGIELKVKGDGQRYKFLMRSDLGWDSVAFAHSFDTVANEWITVQVPFTQMIPVFRARTLENVSLNSQTIRSLQLMLSKFEYDRTLNPKFTPGQFSLTIAWIKAYQ